MKTTLVDNRPAPDAGQGAALPAFLDRRKPSPPVSDRPKFEPHPFAEILPLLEGPDFDELAADIKARGLDSPITLFENMILDGRNRERACAVAGVEPRYVQYVGDDPIGFVVSANIKRRHLDPSQRAWAAAQIETLRHGGDRRSDQAANLHLDREAAAKTWNISVRSVASAAVVRGHGEPELKAAVEQGQMAVDTAAKATRLKPKVQRKLAAQARLDKRRALQRDMKIAIRADKERALAQKISALPSKFGVILMDAETILLGAASVQLIAAEDAVLFLRAKPPMLARALEAMTALGFQYKSAFAWVKPCTRITGSFNHKMHELLLTGTRGKVPAPAQGTLWPSVIKTDDAGERPEAFLALIESYFPTLPKIEINRHGPAREGWASRGIDHG